MTPPIHPANLNFFTFFISPKRFFNLIASFLVKLTFSTKLALFLETSIIIGKKNPKKKFLNNPDHKCFVIVKLFSTGPIPQK